MQFTTTVLALVGTLAASASAQWGSNYTVPASPTGTGGAGGAGGYPGHGGSGGNATMTTQSVPTTSGFEPPSQYGNGAAGRYVGSGLGLLVAGGVAFAL